MTRIKAWLLVALVALLLAAPALASEPAEAEGATHAEPGLLEAMIDWKVIVTAIVTFLVLLFILTKLAWKPILNGLQQREDTIRRAVDDAQKASEEARALAAQYQQRLDEAGEKAREIAEEAKRNAEAVRHRIEDDAKRTAEETLARSLREIAQAKQTAYDELLGSVTAIAAEAASRIVRRDLTTEDNARLVDEVVEEFVASRKRSEA